ncbi:MAG: MFS transporter [Geodermatophilaceae bacterium]|nr:MFS transporter [Geodermatophilaceae bacterium]
MSYSDPDPGNQRLQRRLMLALFGIAFSTQAPSPVLLFYTETLDLSALALTVFFAVYALGLVPSLLLGGPYSDRHGRKRVVLPCTLLCLGALLVLLSTAFLGEPMIYVGRLLQGVTSGAVFTVGVVWLRELAGPQGASAAAMRASAAMASGFAIGPLTTGLLVQWGPLPKLVPYVLPLLLVSLAFFLTRGVPETMTIRRPGRLQIGIPPGAGPGFAAYLLPVGLIVYTYAVVSLTVFPILVAEQGFEAVFALVGVSALLVQGSAAASTGLARRWGPATCGWASALLAAAGCIFGYLAVQPDGWPYVLPASLLIGVSEGLAITSGITVSDLLAPADRRGGLVSVFYLVVYFGFAVPTIVALVARDALRSGIPILVLGGLALVLGAVLFLAGRTVLQRRTAATLRY